MKLAPVSLKVAAMAMAAVAVTCAAPPAWAFIIGEESRQPIEDFSKPENADAHAILGMKDIEEETSGVVTVACYYGRDGKAYKNIANGVLACDRRTVLIAAHQLREPMCSSDGSIEITCVINEDRHNPEPEFFEQPDRAMILPYDVCDPVYHTMPDLAIMRLEVPSERKPVKIGVAEYPAIHGLRFVNVATNVAANYRGADGGRVDTERTFMVGTFKSNYSLFEAKTDLDIDRGSSGSAALIGLDGELVALGSVAAMTTDIKDDLDAPNFRPYDIRNNYSVVTYYSGSGLAEEFFEKNIEDFEACRRPIPMQD